MKCSTSRVEDNLQELTLEIWVLTKQSMLHHLWSSWSSTSLYLDGNIFHWEMMCCGCGIIFMSSSPWDLIFFNIFLQCIHQQIHQPILCGLPEASFMGQDVKAPQGEWGVLCLQGHGVEADNKWGMGARINVKIKIYSIPNNPFLL